MPIYCYSGSDDGPFTGECETMEEAVAEGSDCYPDSDFIFIGEVVPVSISEVVPSFDQLLDDMDEAAFDLVGDVSEGWTEKVDTKKYTPQYEAAMKKLLESMGIWPAKFSKVKNVTEHRVKTAPKSAI